MDTDCLAPGHTIENLAMPNARAWASSAAWPSMGSILEKYQALSAMTVHEKEEAMSVASTGSGSGEGVMTGQKVEHCCRAGTGQNHARAVDFLTGTTRLLRRSGLHPELSFRMHGNAREDG